MNKISRRKFIKKSAKIGAVIGFPAIIPASALGRGYKRPPSERVNIGLISCGSQSIIANDYQDYEKSQVVAVCDPIAERRLAKKKQFGGCADTRSAIF